MDSSDLEPHADVDLHAHADGELSEREGLLIRLRRALFDSFLSLSQHASNSRTLFLLFHLLGFFQLIFFPLSPLLYWRAKGSEGNVVYGFQGFLTAIALVPWQDKNTFQSGYPPVALFTAAVALSGLTCVLFALLLYFQDKGIGRFQVQVLGILLHVGLTAGTVPIFANLVSPLFCRVSWGVYVCWSGSHLAACIIGVCLTIPTLLVLALASVMFKSPALDLKLNPTLKAHGRGQAAQLFLRVSMAVFFVLGADTTPWAHAIVNLLGASGLLGLQLYFLEYYDQTINRVMCALHAMYLAGGVACILSVGLYNPPQASGVTSASLVWVFLTPMVSWDVGTATRCLTVWLLRFSS